MQSNPLLTIPVGVRFMFLSALGFSLMTACVKAVHEYGIPVFEIVAVRALVSFVISYADVKRKGISVWGNNRPLLLLRGAIGTFSLICVYYSVTSLPLAEATILQYTHPIFTALLAVFFLKERIQPPTLICIVLCILGLYCILLPELDGSSKVSLPTLSVIVALLGAFGSSIAYVIVRKLSQTEDSSVIILYFPMIATPISILLVWNDFIWPDMKLTFMLIMIGVFTQIGQYGLTKAMKTQEAGKASAFSYVQIVFSIVIGLVYFDEIPAMWTYIGGALIVIGALINVFGQRIGRRKTG
ncbi:DMT family transporter [Vibrio ziniensis]|uniref:DMT family transporter n=1 Tax=Vibrio ziniensis TaxID=2711221 RepID=A0A6G7CI01_9VIBR|nr:DMT family transporter [Vibrio ziniensis]QIH41722.1 DMT family transporter [Vibrio ziniensis]